MAVGVRPPLTGSLAKRKKNAVLKCYVPYKRKIIDKNTRQTELFFKNEPKKQTQNFLLYKI